MSAFTKISSWRQGLIDYDPANRSQEIFHRHHDGSWTVEHQQDVEPILDANKEAQNHCNTWNEASDIVHVARIPPIFIDKWFNELGIDYFNKDHQDAVNRLLDDPDYRWMRTNDMVLSKRKVTKAQIERRLAERRLWSEIA